MTLRDGQRHQQLIMAAMLLPILGFLLLLLQSLGAQTIIGLSPYFDHQEPPVNPSADTHQGVLLWPSLPPSGRSDVPIRPTVKDKLTNTGQQGQRSPHATPQSPPSFISALSTHNLSSGPLITQPPSARARTDTAHLANRGHLAKVDATSKGLPPPQPTIFLSALSENPAKEANSEATDHVLQDLGSGDEIPVHLPAFGDEMAQYQPPQITVSKVPVLEPTAEGHTPRPQLFPLTTPSAEARATAPPVGARTQHHAVISSGKN